MARPAQVGAQETVGTPTQRRHLFSVERRYRCRRVEVFEEEDFALVDVADPGQHSLRQQEVAHRTVLWEGGGAPQVLRRVEFRPGCIGAEMADGPLHNTAPLQFDGRRREANRGDHLGGSTRRAAPYGRRHRSPAW
jgi:hypothetical protein